jgi:hypothetical protein
MAMTSDQLRQRLERECRKAGGQTAWAYEHGLSVAYVSDVLRKQREPSSTIARALGYQRQMIFRKKSSRR